MISSQTSYYLRMRKRDLEIACQVKLRFGSSKIGRRFDDKLTDKFDLHVFHLSIEFFNDLAGLLEPCWKVSPSQVDQKSYQTKHGKMFVKITKEFANPPQIHIGRGARVGHGQTSATAVGKVCVGGVQQFYQVNFQDL